MSEYYDTIAKWLENEHSIYELAKIYGDIRADLEDAMRYACTSVQDYYESQIHYAKRETGVGNPTGKKK